MATILGVWIGLLYPAMLLAACPAFDWADADAGDHGCCSRKTPMPECPSPQCLKSPEKAPLQATEARFLAGVIQQPRLTAASVSFSTAPFHAVSAPRSARSAYLMNRVLLI